MGEEKESKYRAMKKSSLRAQKVKRTVCECESPGCSNVQGLHKNPTLLV